METAINAMWDTLPTCGDNIFILGGGIVGFHGVCAQINYWHRYYTY